MTRSLWLLCWGLTLLSLGGCAALSSGQAGDPPVGAVLAANLGRVLTPAELSERLDATQVLLAGEIHDHPGHHQAQLELLRAMEQPGRPLVVGIEWLDWKAQEACDRLSRGEVSVEEFARLADWERRWGFPLSLYAPILERVRERHHRLVALNAPVEAVRQVAQHGLQSLEPGRRALLAPILDLNDAPYRERMLAMARQHGLGDSKAMENFFIAQVARDETMAWRLSLALLPWPDGGGRAVVLAGGGHLSDGQGLPPRIRRLLPGVRLTTALPVDAQAARPPEPGASWPADLLVVAPPAPPPPPRLGLVLKPVDEGLLVERIFPDSPAAKAGLWAGDVLLSLDGNQLRQIKHIHDAIRMAPRAPHVFRLRRGDKEMEISVSMGQQPS